jgi:hypothetical protein
MANDTESVSEFAALWNQLTPLQRRFVVAMQEHPTKKEAAIALAISPNTVYNWPSIVDTAVSFAVNNVALATLGIMQANATKAAMVKAKGLDSDNERIAQDAATEILDRNLGRPTQRQELTGADGDALRIKLEWGDIADAND